jgi:hypothetical protein
VHILLDFIHVLEYLWKAAWSLFYTGDTAAETWVAEQADRLLGRTGRSCLGAAPMWPACVRHGVSST